MRMRSLTNVLTVAILVVLAACASKKPTTRTSTTVPPKQTGQYSEDLSSLRPVVQATDDKTPVVATDDRKATPYVEAKYNVNKQVDTVLDSIDRLNLHDKYVEGFTIQVYSGVKQEALNVKRQLTQTLPEVSSDLIYQQPTFRVKIGKYTSRLEAQRDYLLVKKHFPAAIVVPEKIPLN